MALAAGTLLGPYEVLSPLGAGGMGEVYRARDTRLRREVAVKILPDSVANDPRALSRFEGEARAVAALSHPNILALYDVGEAAGIHYEVTELLEGETLRGLLSRGAVAVKRALEIAQQIAQGLAAAHEKGVVHRDVKPENVFLTRDGHAKILDFGLAKVTSRPGSEVADTHSPTVEQLTSDGSIVGTVTYMSPEQARGGTVDFRSDQFSLGVVLYEMLAGGRPFAGTSAVDLLVAIVRDEPEPLQQRARSVPGPVCWVVERLLAKEPGGRYHSTRDLVSELEAVRSRLSEPGVTSGAGRLPEPAPKRRRIVPLAASAALIAAGVVAGALGRGLFPRGPARAPDSVERFEIRLPEGHYLSQWRRPLALSPDGSLLVFSAFTWKKPFEEGDSPRLFLRALDSYDAKALPGTEGGVQPVFSPDGKHVAFTARSGGRTFLRRVPVAGGPVTTICTCEATFGVDWSSDGSLVFAAEAGPLLRVSDGGGTPEPATALDAGEAEVSHRLPHLLPDGRTVIYTALRWETAGMSWTKARVFGQRLGEKERTLLVEGGSDGRWVSPGYLLFAREARLFSAPLDARSLRLGGRSVPVVEGVSHSIWTGDSSTETGAVLSDVSRSRTFAWVPGAVSPEWEFSAVLRDVSGKETPTGIPKGPLLSARVSADGRRILVSYSYPGRQVEVLDLDRGARRNVTFDENPLWVIWGPGPDRITFTSDHEGPPRIYSRRVDAGPDGVEILWKGMGRGDLGLGSWSPDGKTLAFTVNDGKTGEDIWLLEAGRQPRPFVASRFTEMQADISPDGRWLLYASDEPGRFEVFLRPLAGEGGVRQVSVGGGTEPLWSRDGSAIYYRGRTEKLAGMLGAADLLVRVPVSRGREGFALGSPDRVLEGRYGGVTPGHSWGLVSNDRFLFVKSSEPSGQRAWLEKSVSGRVRVDVGGLLPLLSEAGKRRPAK